MNCNNCRVAACSYAHISENVVMFNLKQFSDVLIIELPRKFSKYYVCGLESLIPSEHSLDVDTIHKRNIWLDIPIDCIDTDVGQHIYKIYLKSENDMTESIYFSYMIQNDNPDKPYVYMKRNKQDEEVKE